MGITVSGQVGFILSAILLGFALGCLYDVFRFIRIITRCKKTALFFLDILYWLICAVSAFIFMLIQNSGRIRFIPIIAGILGAAVYYNTLGVIFIKKAEKIDRKIKKRTKEVCAAAMIPIRRSSKSAASKISESGRYAGAFIKKENKLLKIRLKVKAKMLYNLRCSAKRSKSFHK